MGERGGGFRLEQRLECLGKSPLEWILAIITQTSIEVQTPQVSHLPWLEESAGL